ncbi:MAG: phosphoribosylformylglycinamidine cyclo-ligase [Candidatus Omnitrophica bacterium]|nr:phosphoribosylformylglycinamidine cyclo-ligase [Candidatus Omnitrophota bacterium]
MRKITYKQAGVDIRAASAFKRSISPLVRASFRPEVLTDIGGFGSFFRFRNGKYKEPVLVASADGVGTKLKIAGLAGKHDTVGIDAVAMNVNDILCTGAEPLFFLDYIGYSSVSAGVLREVVKGITRGCVQAGCALIGGETAQMPGMYADGEYDIAGFCVGVAERSRLIDGKGIQTADAVIGLASSGLHSNGYSLVRGILSTAEMKRMSRELLKPTRIYVKPVLSLFKSYSRDISGVAHITGGAFYDKIARILPRGVDAVIRKGSWNVPPLFRLLQKKGGISEREMYHTLNMGIGMAVIVRRQRAGRIIADLARLKVKALVIGEVVRGKGKVRIV